MKLKLSDLFTRWKRGYIPRQEDYENLFDTTLNTRLIQVNSIAGIEGALDQEELGPELFVVTVQDSDPQYAIYTFDSGFVGSENPPFIISRATGGAFISIAGSFSQVEPNSPHNDFAEKSLRFTYDYQTDGATGTIVLSTLPQNAVITRCELEVREAFGPAGSSLSLGIDTQLPEALLTIGSPASNNLDTTGWKPTLASGSLSDYTEMTTAQRDIVLTISGSSLTSGAFTGFINYRIL